MEIGVLGTGAVGRAIATKLVEIGHRVRLGSRTARGERALAWSRETGEEAGTFADVAATAELVFNCTAGAHSLAALNAAGEANLAGKIVIDVANPLDFSGEAPALMASSADSLAERIQRTFPAARVVKALNTVNNAVMVSPGSVPGDHVVFICGDDPEAKDRARGVLGELGWPRHRVLDLGPLSSARGTELYLALWLVLTAALGTTQFNIEIRQEKDG